MADTCRSCGAPILWVFTEGGKRMPVDAKPASGLVLDDPESPTPTARIRRVYTSHFATCPQAAQHRKAR
jgi:hypothetical protein